MARSLLHTVALRPAEDSIAAFNALFRDDARRKEVNKIDLCTLRDEDEEFERDEGKGYSMDPWQECVSRIPDLPNLREVSLKFSPHVGNPEKHWDYHPPEDVALRTGVLNTLFKALDSKDLNIDTLSIENLQDYTPGVYTTPAFKNVRNKIKKLHLKIAMEWNEYGPSGDLDRQVKHDFFNRELNSHWLEPLQSQLTHLTIYADDFWGLYPRLDLRAIHFPHLKSLSLGQWSIAHQWQIDWLLAHASTLEELYLDNCPIVTAARLFDEQRDPLSWEPDELSVPEDDLHREYYMFPSLRWSLILSSLCQRFTHLRKFGMMTSPHWSLEGGDKAFQRWYTIDTRLEPTRYIHFDAGSLPSAWIQDEQAKTDDCVRFDSCWMSDLSFDDDADMTRMAFPKERASEEIALKALVEGMKK